MSQPPTHDDSTAYRYVPDPIRSLTPVDASAITDCDWATALWALLIAVVVGDVVTTAYGLHIGLRERNPFVAGLLAEYGAAGMIALKLVAVAWVAVVWRFCGRKYGYAALLGATLPQAVAVGINAVVISAA